MIAILLNAGNDVSGNPRRVFVVLNNKGDIVEAIDEGYGGKAALFDKYPAVNRGLSPSSFSTTPKEYRELLKDWSK